MSYGPPRTHPQTTHTTGIVWHPLIRAAPHTWSRAAREVYTTARQTPQAALDHARCGHTHAHLGGATLSTTSSRAATRQDSITTSKCTAPRGAVCSRHGHMATAGTYPCSTGRLYKLSPPCHINIPLMGPCHSLILWSPPSESPSSQVTSSQVKSSQVKSSQVKSSQVK